MGGDREVMAARGDSKSSERILMPGYLKGNPRSGKSESNRLIELYVEGVNAEAKILGIAEAGSYAGRLYYRISLEVRPEHTRKFKTTGYAPVSGSLVPKPGDTINIKYSAIDTEKFVII